MKLTGGLTVYGMTWDSVLALRVHGALKKRGYTNIKVLVINGRYTAVANKPGRGQSENFQGNNQKSVWN